MTDRFHTEAITHLRNLLRLNTTNPPGNEIAAVKYIAGVLMAEGIPSYIFEPAPGRANLVATLKGNGSRKPLLLNAHLDVVPAEEKHWKYPPFSGELAEGCVWGRGAIDMKQTAVMSMMMLIRAKREKISLNRDLIFCAVADEEEGCRYGSRWLVENRADLIQAEYGLNEVGGFSLYVDKHVFYPVGVAEKGVCWFAVHASGEPGHGSLPHSHQAVLKLAEGVTKLSNFSLPPHPHPLVRGFIGALAKSQGLLRGSVLKMLTVPRVGDFILKHLIRDPKQQANFHAQLHNTVSPTVLRAGSKINVIPSGAEVTVDGRILPGQTIENFLEEVKKVLGPDLEIKPLYSWTPTEHDYKNDFFTLLKKSLIAHDPEAIPVPYLMPGFSDSAHYARLGIKVYGFSPVRLDRGMNFSELFHGHNERIPVEGFKFGLNVMWDVVSQA